MSRESATLRIEAPGKNALSTALMQDVIRQLGAAGGRPLLVIGTGDSFSAGLNLKEVAASDAAGMERFLRLLDEMVAALFAYPAPMVACVNGHAIAGGCIIALCAEHRVAIDDPATRIGLNEVALGLEFPPRILRLAQYRVPQHTRERVLLEAALHDPRSALALGLVDVVSSDPEADARAWLDAVSRHPADVYTATKRTLRAGAIDPSEAERRYFESTVLPRWTAPAVKEAARAALAR
jgi:enoyl-CoA hydratase/carnithine racemase